MNQLICLIAAAVIGWIATELTVYDSAGLLMNVIAAVVGGFLAAYFRTPIFHVGRFLVRSPSKPWR